jgi:hypothetical protein
MDWASIAPAAITGVVGLAGIGASIWSARIAGKTSTANLIRSIGAENERIREAEMRNARQLAYKEFLSTGTTLHRACVEVTESTEPDKARLLTTPRVEFDRAYIVLQMVTDEPVFLAGRNYNWRFPDLEKAAREGNGTEIDKIGREIREARHRFLEAVRREGGLAADGELFPMQR